VFVWLDLETTHTLVIALELPLNTAKIHILEFTVKSLLINHVLFNHVKTVVNVPILDLELHSPVLALMDGSELLAQFLQLIIVNLNNVDHSEFVSLMLLLETTLLDVSVLSDILELTAPLNQLFVLENV